MAAKQHRRFVFRYSLRALLCFILVLGGALAWLAYAIRQADAQRRIVETLSSEGWVCLYDYQLDSEREIYADLDTREPTGPAWVSNSFGRDFLSDVVWLQGQGLRPTQEAARSITQLSQIRFIRFSQCSRLTDDQLWFLESLEELEELEIVNCPINGRALRFISSPRLVELRVQNTPLVNDDSMQYVARLTELRTLNLSLTRVSSAGLAQLGALRKLETLVLASSHWYGYGVGDESFDYEGPSVANSDMEWIARLSSLAELNISGSDVDRDGLVRLQSLPRLRWLNLKDTKADDDAIRVLAGIPSIETLSVAGTSVTDTGLSHLSNLPRLKSLDLSRTRVSDEGLRTIQGMGALEQVFLSGSKVTAAGASKLSRERPDLMVVFPTP